MGFAGGLGRLRHRRPSRGPADEGWSWFTCGHRHRHWRMAGELVGRSVGRTFVVRVDVPGWAADDHSDAGRPLLVKAGTLLRCETAVGDWWPGHDVFRCHVVSGPGAGSCVVLPGADTRDYEQYLDPTTSAGDQIVAGCTLLPDSRGR